MADYGDTRQRRWRKRVDRRADESGAPKSRWDAAAKRWGLRVDHEEDGDVVFSGSFAGAAVTVFRRSSTTRTYDWTIVVARGGVDRDIMLSRETAMTRAKKLLGGGDVVTGAAEFDDNVYVVGERAHLLGALDAHTRRVAASLVQRGAVLANGELTLVRRTNTPDGVPSNMRRDIESAARLMRQIAMAKDDVHRRLLDNARDDPDVDVRIASLDLLWRRYPNDIGAIDWPTRGEGLKSIEWRVALLSQRSTVGELERWLDDESLPAEARTAFLDRIERRLPRSDAIKILGRQADARTALGADTRRRMLGRLDMPALFQGLLRSTLTALLTQASSSERIGLIRVLAEVGGNEALEALAPYTSGLLLSRTLKETARRAIGQIERRTTTNRGRLSVAVTPDAGRLSVSGAGGDVSLVDE